MAAAVPPVQTLVAPSHWRRVEFISDLHLQASDAATFEAWQRYLGATQADAVFILGDLFEVWVGDDAAAPPGFLADCADVLREAAARRTVYFMHGNRDFLVGARWLDSVGVTLLADPTVLDFIGARWLLSHGDALCLADTEYLRFRDDVRAPGWQREFLQRPLADRQEVARGLRAQSEARKRSGEAYADVDAAAATHWLEAAGASAMIHGHTHRPAEHALGGGRRRIVLSDWDAEARPPRLEALRVSAAGAERIALA